MIVKISEVTLEHLTDYIRLDDPGEIELDEIMRMKESAIAQMSAYTGLSEDEMEEYADITQALFVLVADMFDNRNYQIDKSGKTNDMVHCILNMHSVNLL